MGERAAVIGLGKSGRAASLLLKEEGFEVLGFDLNEDLQEVKKELEGKGIKVELGSYDERSFEGVSLVILSPGVDPKAELFGRLKEKGVKVIGELEFAFQRVKEPIVAITGTNGKSTTTSLIGHILQKGGLKAFVGGNLGTPLSEYVLSGEKADVLVLEVSSFQLETIETFRPFISVFLNISDDHYDRHKDFADYLRAKANIFKNQTEEDFAILNFDDPVLKGFEGKIRPKVIPIAKKPLKGIFLEGERIRWNLEGKEGAIELKGIPLKGPHNLENVMASIGASLLLGLDEERIREGLYTFQPLPHRLQFVAEVKGVLFYDDSKATNPHATLRALEAFETPVILIAGGLDKGVDLSVLRSKAEKLKAIVAIGAARPKLKEIFQDLIPLFEAEDMEEAVKMAFSKAEPGECVLLSPSCASFDLFRDYKHRGEVFQEAVRRLASEKGL